MKAMHTEAIGGGETHMADVDRVTVSRHKITGYDNKKEGKTMDYRPVLRWR